MKNLHLVVLWIFFAGFCASASAQTIESREQENLTAIDAPSPTDAVDTIPDWYQRFSTFERVDLPDNLVELQDQDVKFNFAQGQKWSVQLALKSHAEPAGLIREEMWAGASFNITSRLSVGGGVSLSAGDMNSSSIWADEEVDAGIRLQSAFKF